MNQEFIYLASSSPRRRELLDQIGMPFQVHAVPVDESRHPDEDPEHYVQRLAHAKAAAACASLGAAAEVGLLAADTVVVLADEVLGKPQDRDDALRMLQALSGRSHKVLTAVTFFAAGKYYHRCSHSTVAFRTLSYAECERYWDSGEPSGKAGSYAIQGRAAVFVRRIEGSYSGVMGLPLYDTAQLMAGAGVAIPATKTLSVAAGAQRS